MGYVSLPEGRNIISPIPIPIPIHHLQVSVVTAPWLRNASAHRPGRPPTAPAPPVAAAPRDGASPNPRMDVFVVVDFHLFQAIFIGAPCFLPYI